MFLQVLAFPFVEETRDPAGSHYTSISKSASGPSRSRRQSAIWPCICLYVVIIVDIYVCNSSVYTWCSVIVYMWVTKSFLILSESVN